MGGYEGVYHILNGLISPLNGINPDDINLKSLFERVDNDGVSEIILALADDLTTSCIISEWDYRDTLEKIQWYERYCEHHPVGISSYKPINKR